MSIPLSFGASTSAPPPASDPGVVCLHAQGPSGPCVYELPESAIAQYPLLLSPETRFLRLDSVYELLCGHPISLISDRLLNDADDRARISYVAEKIGYNLTPQQIQYICESTGMLEQLKTVRRHLKSWGTTLREIFAKGKERITRFCTKFDDMLRGTHPEALARGINAQRLIHGILEKGFPQLYMFNHEHSGCLESFCGTYNRKFLGGAGDPK